MQKKEKLVDDMISSCLQYDINTVRRLFRSSNNDLGTAMTKAQVIDGKALAENLLKELAGDIANLPTKRAPGLATILVGDNPASSIYVANKRRQAQKIGIKSFHHELKSNIEEKELIDLIHKLNHDPIIDAILIQLPLPKEFDENRVIEEVDPRKDVDGLHPLNLGYLLRGEPQVIACTPLGVMHLIKSVNFDLQGKHAVVIGRSNIVGKPMAHLLLQGNATVTICHSHTKDLVEISQQADLVVAAIGKTKIINHRHIKKGAFVIDVGINRDENHRLCGDVDFFDLLEIASYITPVPGGVGPLTIAMLLKNTFNNFLRNLSFV
jgi:methylenetetrahydrofolate dehydrogenase (NADP+)/methenyltetrahydrofolate cyclohydrolase